MDNNSPALSVRNTGENKCAPTPEMSPNHRLPIATSNLETVVPHPFFQTGSNDPKKSVTKMPVTAEPKDKVTLDEFKKTKGSSEQEDIKNLHGFTARQSADFSNKITFFADFSRLSTEKRKLEMNMKEIKA